MRLWTIHPRYLDRQGLIALWREALLAQAVLAGKTRGYRSHPQLARFRAARDPMAAIGAFLVEVAREAEVRGYAFATSKIVRRRRAAAIAVSRGQLRHETLHLRAKLLERSPELLASLPKRTALQANPIFRVVAGPVEPWEVQRGALRRAAR